MYVKAGQQGKPLLIMQCFIIDKAKSKFNTRALRRISPDFINAIDGIIKLRANVGSCDRGSLG